MNNFVFFHGTQDPVAEFANAFDGDVVLQPFHPLVANGRYATWFPNARRWIYTNPTSVDPHRQLGVADNLLTWDPGDRWEIARLRLPEGLPTAIEDAAKLATEFGATGIFIDDLDRLLFDEDVLDEYLHALATKVPGPFFVNRAFSALHLIPRLEAVLAEDLNRDLAKPSAHHWVQETVLSGLKWAKFHGCQIHRLEYATAPALPAEAAAIDAAIDELCTTATVAVDEGLTRWEGWL